MMSTRDWRLTPTNTRYARPFGYGQRPGWDSGQRFGGFGFPVGAFLGGVLGGIAGSALYGGFGYQPYPYYPTYYPYFY